VKILFDQNISFRVVKSLSTILPDCNQVRQLGLENATDREIWAYAKENDYAIATFDADFYDLVTLYGHPPKVIWLRTGNIKSDDLIVLIEKRTQQINAFLHESAYKEIGCLEVLMG